MEKFFSLWSEKYWESYTSWNTCRTICMTSVQSFSVTMESLLMCRRLILKKLQKKITASQLLTLDTIQVSSISFSNKFLTIWVQSNFGTFHYQGQNLQRCFRTSPTQGFRCYEFLFGKFCSEFYCVSPKKYFSRYWSTLAYRKWNPCFQSFTTMQLMPWRSSILQWMGIFCVAYKDLPVLVARKIYIPRQCILMCALMWISLKIMCKKIQRQNSQQAFYGLTGSCFFPETTACRSGMMCL